jgi:MFS transporter, PPP family, 3-phenylpropionic acid transporter
MQDSRLTFKFSIVQSLYWCGCCIIVSFLTPYYISLGYDTFMIGVLSMILALSSTIAQPLWGVYCDRSGKLEQAFSVSVVVSLPFAYLLVAAGKNTILLCIAIFMLSATFLSMPSIIDAWIIKLGNHGEQVNYSLTRGFGSMFFAIVAIVFGYVLDRAGMWVISPAFIVFAVAMLAASFLIKAPMAEDHHGRGNGSARQSLGKLIRNRKFMVLILSVTILYIGTSAIDMTFYPVLLRKLGGGNTELGIGLFLMAFSEVPVMFFYNRIARRFKERSMICFSLFSYVVKCLIIASAPNVLMLVLAQGLQMFSFGLLLPAVVNYINNITDSSTMVTAQLMYSSATYGVGAIIGSVVGGAIAQALGVRPMMFILFLLVVLAFALFTVLSRNDRRAVMDDPCSQSNGATGNR